MAAPRPRPRPPLPWLYRTASHHVLHSWRSRGRAERLAARLHAEPAPSVDDHADQVATALDQSAQVRAALATPSPRDGEVLRLATWECPSPPGRVLSRRPSPR